MTTWRAHRRFAGGDAISIAAAALLLAIVGSAQAVAGTARVDVRPTANGSAVARLSYDAAPGERNNLRVTTQASADGALAYIVNDDAGLVAGANCALASEPKTLRCAVPPGTSPTGPLVELGDESDMAIVDDVVGSDSRINGGAGHDQIWALGVLRGGRGDDGISGGGTLVGGPGEDEIGTVEGPAVIRPGPGVDLVRWQNGDNGPRVVDTRDGFADAVTCGQARDQFTVDAVDWVGHERRQERGACGRIRRTGDPRAVAIPHAIFDVYLYVPLGCPIDAAGPCAGTVALSRRGRRPREIPYRVPRGRKRGVKFFPSSRARARIIHRGARVAVRTDSRFGRTLIARSVLIPVVLDTYQGEG